MESSAFDSSARKGELQGTTGKQKLLFLKAYEFMICIDTESEDISHEVTNSRPNSPASKLGNEEERMVWWVMHWMQAHGYEFISVATLWDPRGYPEGCMWRGQSLETWDNPLWAIWNSFEELSFGEERFGVVIEENLDLCSECILPIDGDAFSNHRCEVLLQPKFLRHSGRRKLRAFTEKGSSKAKIWGAALFWIESSKGPSKK